MAFIQSILWIYLHSILYNLAVSMDKQAFSRIGARVAWITAITLATIYLLIIATGSGEKLIMIAEENPGAFWSGLLIYWVRAIGGG